MDFNFDAVIIDTSALENFQFDFCGWTTKTLPSFFDSLKEKNIRLLNHPVLDGEIKKHIGHSQLLERFNGLQQNIQRNKDFYKLIGVCPEEAIKRLSELDIEKMMLSEYNAIFDNATMLSFVSPERIFEKYFTACPPFSEKGNKKSEFPDAFIIESVNDYLRKNAFQNVIVVSKDDDWKQAFAKVERASFCDSIDDALKMIQSTERIDSIVANCEKEIIESLQFQAECECYDLPEFQVPTNSGVEISSVKVHYINDIIPLRITSSTALFKCSAHLFVDGSARIIDETRSVWDNEEKDYLFVAYSDIVFKNGQAEIECEITIKYSPEDDDYTAQVSESRIITKYAIDIDLENADVTEEECTDDQLAYEALLEDHRINKICGKGYL